MNWIDGKATLVKTPRLQLSLRNIFLAVDFLIKTKPFGMDMSLSMEALTASAFILREIQDITVEFKEIGSQWPYMDLSLIPIGTYVPRKFMQPVHCSPEEAVEIHRDVRSKLSIGMHWKTFCLSDEPLHMPPYDLYLSMKEKKVPFETFLPIDPGVYVNW